MFTFLIAQTFMDYLSYQRERENTRKQKPVIYILVKLGRTFTEGGGTFSYPNMATYSTCLFLLQYLYFAGTFTEAGVELLRKYVELLTHVDWLRLLIFLIFLQ